MRAHRRTSVWIVSMAIPAFVAACGSETARYRVLSFFFDGVPKPGEQKRDARMPGPRAFVPASQPAEAPRTAEPLFAHAPWRDGRCRDCHDPGTRLLYQSTDDDLCRSCHTTIGADAEHVHAPVASNECAACHAPHESRYAGLLIEASPDLCLRCHASADLKTCSRAGANAAADCLECHVPHAADDPFLLRPRAP